MNSSKSVIAANLRALIARDGGTIRSWALKHGLEPRDIDRTVKSENSITIGKLDQIADAVGLSAWQLLVKDMNVESPPQIAVTEDELRLFERLRNLANKGS